MKFLRNTTVIMAVISLLYLFIGLWFGIEVPQELKDIVDLVAYVFIALGILTDTSVNAGPLTKASILEKLKSPLGIGALYALLSYIVYMKLAPAEADTLLKVIDTILYGIFGFSVYNSMNVRNGIRVEKE